MQSNRGFSCVEISRIQNLVEANQTQLLAGWNEFFDFRYLTHPKSHYHRRSSQR
ncbi:hypothetical protein [Synechocystis sp. LEGE 06083]|uniref:hypothetical protein n=1 Tax=Synechocystis sp. LEGE 06083 TaxID=915336 RepID=UPI0034CDD9E6